MKQKFPNLRRGLTALVLSLLLCAQALAAMPEYLVPGGSTAGIKLYTGGLLITALDEDAPAQRAADTGFRVVEGNGADAGNVVAHRYAKAVALLRLLRCQEKLRLFLPALNQKPHALSAGELPDGVRCGRDASAVYF